MKYVDEFRDPQLLRNALDEIRSLVSSGRLYRIMEVCGGHTHSIFRFGLKELLPPEVELIHGPGCHPIGALMVSSEGACAAHFKYAGVKLQTVAT